MSLIDTYFTDVTVYIVVFKSKSNNMEFTRTIVGPFFPSSEQEGINYIKKLLEKVFQENVSISSIDWMTDAWIPKE